MSAATAEMGILTLTSRETGKVIFEGEVPRLALDAIEQLAAKENRSEDDVFSDWLRRAAEQNAGGAR